MKRILIYTFALFAFVGCNLDGMQTMRSKLAQVPDEPLHVLESEENIEKEPGCIRIVQYNVGGFFKSGSSSINMVVDMMKEIDTDVMSLNEVDKVVKRSNNVDQLKVFATNMGNVHSTATWKYYFAQAINLGSGEYGNGVAAKPEYNMLKTEKIYLPHTTQGEQRCLAIVEFNDFVFCATHLDLQEIREAQATRINEYITSKYGSVNKPIFLCGDMNCTPGTDPILEFEKKWTMVSQNAPTASSSSPKSCIDFIFLYNNDAAKKVEIVKTKVLRNFASGSVATASDHLPVFVDFKFL